MEGGGGDYEGTYENGESGGEGGPNDSNNASFGEGDGSGGMGGAGGGDPADQNPQEVLSDCLKKFGSPGVPITLFQTFYAALSTYFTHGRLFFFWVFPENSRSGRKKTQAQL